MEFLLAAGFEEEQASTALQSVSGNVEHAIAILCDRDQSHRETPSQYGRDANTAQSERHQAIPKQPPASAGGGVPISASRGETWSVTCGCSQFTFGAGASACTSVCVEAAQRFLLSIDSTEVWKPSGDELSDIVFQGVALHGSVLAELDGSCEHTTADEVLGSVAAQAGGRPHLAILASMLQADISRPNAFASLLREVMERCEQEHGSASHVAVLLTKPPETVLVLLPVRDRANPNLAPVAADTDTCTGTDASTASMTSGSFILFDSHPRPVCGREGAYMSSFSSLAGLAGALEALFPGMLLEGVDPVHAMLYNTVEATAVGLSAETTTALGTT